MAIAIFGLLWILDSPYREFYLPNALDVLALADGLLLASGAHWEDWFTRGYSILGRIPRVALHTELTPRHRKDSTEAANRELLRPGFLFVNREAHQSKPPDDTDAR
jgi:hypothetical protein